MELKELTEKTCTLFECGDVGELGQALIKCVLENDTGKFVSFCELVQQDLSVDWLQKIYQYYRADRKEKMQDYTPKSLADLIGRLAGEADIVIDMCAGSGALTIQRWNQNRSQKFELHELDGNVIPYLLFNLAVRNIESIVCQSDILQGEIYKTWVVTAGPKYGDVREVQQ